MYVLLTALVQALSLGLAWMDCKPWVSTEEGPGHMQEGSPVKVHGRAASHPHCSGLQMEKVPCKLFPRGSKKPGDSSSSGSGKVTPHQKEKEQEIQNGLQIRVLLPRSQGMQGQFGGVPVQKGGLQCSGLDCPPEEF